MNTPNKYTNLVLEGCASKLFAFCGSLSVLEKEGILQNINYFIGTSSGAILSTMILLGYNTQEMLNLLIKTDSYKLLYSSYFYGFLNLKKYLGYYSHEKYRNWLKTIFIFKNVDVNITFKQLFDKTHKILIIAGTCLNKQTTHYYHYQTNPNMPIYKALLITSCIPLIFEPIKWKNDILVDAGLSESFPIYILDANNTLPNTRQQLVHYDPNVYSHNFKTLGIKIMTQEDSSSIIDIPIRTLKELIISIINILHRQIERDNIRASYWNQTIKIKIPKNYAWNYLHISYDKRLELVEYGKISAQEFLNTIPNISNQDTI